MKSLLRVASVLPRWFEAVTRCVLERVVYGLLEGWFAALSVRRTACELPLYFRSAQMADALSPTVERALLLIERLDNRRFQRLRRDIKRVFIIPAQMSFQSLVTGTCYLREQTARDQGSVPVASALVHEAVHARLHSRGVENFPRLRRVRTEELCCSEEIAFARLIPDRELSLKGRWLDVLHRRLHEYPPTVQ